MAPSVMVSSSSGDLGPTEDLAVGRRHLVHPVGERVLLTHLLVDERPRLLLALDGTAHLCNGLDRHPDLPVESGHSHRPEPDADTEAGDPIGQYRGRSRSVRATAGRAHQREPVDVESIGDLSTPPSSVADKRPGTFGEAP